MKPQQQKQVRPVQKAALTILAVLLPLGTLSASFPASAKGHFSGLNLGQSSISGNSSNLSNKSGDDNARRRRNHRFLFVGDHLFERYDVFYRLDEDSPWIKDESYRSQVEAELEVRRLEHNGYYAKLVRE